MLRTPATISRASFRARSSDGPMLDVVSKASSTSRTGVARTAPVEAAPNPDKHTRTAATTAAKTPIFNAPPSPLREQCCTRPDLSSAERIARTPTFSRVYNVWTAYPSRIAIAPVAKYAR
jgi:hypothetical protein